LCTINLNLFFEGEGLERELKIPEGVKVENGKSGKYYTLYKPDRP